MTSTRAREHAHTHSGPGIWLAWMALLCMLHGGVHVRGCSFLVTTKQDVPLPEHTAAFGDEASWNFLMKLRGPDLTNSVRLNGMHFVHNLLHMTGEVTPQPFYDNVGNVVAIFNGEIYNYKAFGDYASDGQAIIAAYHKFGERFTNKFRGEFAIVLCDFTKGIVVISTDVFAIKPVYVAVQGGQLAIASYESALLRLGFDTPLEQAPNMVVVRSLDPAQDFAVLRRYSVFDFDLRQHKRTLDDWNKAWQLSMERRTEGALHGMFVGMSSGDDSGAIACKMHEMNLSHHLYSIKGHEQMSIVNARFNFAKSTAVEHRLQIKWHTYNNVSAWNKKHVEPYSYWWEPCYWKLRWHGVDNGPSFILPSTGPGLPPLNTFDPDVQV